MSGLFTQEDFRESNKARDKRIHKTVSHTYNGILKVNMQVRPGKQTFISDIESWQE